MRGIVIYIVIGFLNIFIVLPQGNTIKAKIIDGACNQPLPGANVFVKNDILRGTITNLDGEFILELNNNNLKDSLIISFIGFEERIVPITTMLNGIDKISIYPKAHEIEETVIKARRIISEEFTIEKIDQMDIYQNPLSKADPLLAVNGMASSTTTDESANISLRGSSPAETGIFLNDVPVYDAVRFSQINGIGTFSIFNTSIVDQMHVFPSNPPIEYGNSTSGLVSIHSSDEIPENAYHSFMASLASFGIYSSGKLNKKNGFTVFSNYQPSKIFIKVNEKAMEDLEDFSTIDLGMHYMHEFNNSTSLKLFNYTNLEGFEFCLRHPSYNGNFIQEKKRDFMIGNFSKRFTNSEFSINSGVSFSNEKYNYGNTDIDLTKNDIYLSANYYHFFNKLSIKSGIAYDERKNDLNGKFAVFDYAIAPKHPSITINSSDNVPVIEGFTYFKYKITNNLVIGTGVRKNLPGKDQRDYLSYQANINYSFNGLHSFNLSGGQYNKYCIPNAEIHNQFFIRNKQFSFDYELDLGAMEINSAIFYKISDIESRNEEIIGGEVFSRINITDKLEVQASYTYLDALIKDNDIKYPSVYDLSFFIRASLKYTVASNFDISAIYLAREGDYYIPVINGQWDHNLGIYYPIYENLENQDRKPYYGKLDISLSKLHGITDNIGIILFANISNVFNRKNVREINYNENYSQSFNEYYSIRTIYVGGIINFQK
ncbi:carboxypeptidase-like regulatory domain-containing protein [Bacteroidota bacterium]